MHETKNVHFKFCILLSERYHLLMVGPLQNIFMSSANYTELNIKRGTLTNRVNRSVPKTLILYLYIIIIDSNMILLAYYVKDF